MYAIHKQVLDSLVRIRAFIEAHPATGPLTYAGGLTMLDAALAQCRECAGSQISARALDRAAQRRQDDLVAMLRDRHMRPIVTIARAHSVLGTDVGFPAAFRLPKASTSPTKVVASCDGMMVAAREFEAVLIEQGLPADFLDEFARTRDELVATCDEIAALRTERMSAGAGLPVALRRARLAVDRLDAVVRVAFRGDAMVLSAWRRAKRVHLLPGAGAPTLAAA